MNPIDLFDWDLVDREVNRTYRELIITNRSRWSWPQERWVELILRLIKEWMWLLWRQEGRLHSGRLAHAQNRLVKSQELWGNRWRWCKQTARVNFKNRDLQLVFDHDPLWYCLAAAKGMAICFKIKYSGYAFQNYPRTSKKNWHDLDLRRCLPETFCNYKKRCI